MRSTSAASLKPRTASTGAAFPFRDPALPRAVRIEDLLSRLTVGEKISQLVHENVAIERLGVPAYNWWNEACHGIGRNGRATVFPQVIGLAATWDRALVQRVAGAIADEARAKHHAAAVAGRRGQYQGLTFWTPNVNIFRDPRWGRGQETFGEDPYLTGELGVAMMRGLQGDDPVYLKTAACAKHFAVHSGPEAERHTFDAQPTPKDLAETYLPAFKKLVVEGVEAVMGAYNRVLGEPACASRMLLADTLRRDWGFTGHVVSDCGAIDDFHLHHRVTRNAAESAALAVRMGCDLNCGCTYNDLVVAVREGLIGELEIDTALRRLLATKFKLGLFDPPDAVPFTKTSTDIVDSPRHRSLAREAAAASIVLLKNSDGVLPLRRDPASLLVVGPTAANLNAMLGNYAGISSHIVTFVEGIAAQVDENTALEYRAGCALSEKPPAGLNYTFGTAAAADAVIAIVGLDPTLEGEDGDAVASLSGGDRAAIELPEVQREFIRELRRHARKLILVITSGSAVAIPEEHELCDAVLYAWYAGCEGGHALADVLFGEIAPSGRMPVTVPCRTADLPPFDDYHMRGRTYRFADVAPLYPFGFGLSYARLRYAHLAISTPTLKRGETLTVHARIENGSSLETPEVVQLYLAPPQDQPNAPRATLLDFTRIEISAHSAAQIEFRIASDDLLQVDGSGRHAWMPGFYRLFVSPASPGPRAQELGAPAPLSTTLELV